MEEDKPKTEQRPTEDQEAKNSDKTKAEKAAQPTEGGQSEAAKEEVDGQQATPMDAATADAGGGEKKEKDVGDAGGDGRGVKRPPAPAVVRAAKQARTNQAAGADYIPLPLSLGATDPLPLLSTLCVSIHVLLCPCHAVPLYCVLYVPAMFPLCHLWSHRLPSVLRSPSGQHPQPRHSEAHSDQGQSGGPPGRHAIASPHVLPPGCPSLQGSTCCCSRSHWCCHRQGC